MPIHGSYPRTERLHGDLVDFSDQGNGLARNIGLKCRCEVQSTAFLWLGRFKSRELATRCRYIEP